MQGDKAKYCVRCGEVLMPDADRCKDCGWKISGAKRDAGAGSDPDRHRCAYAQGTRRCPLPGASADTTRPDKQTPWYCRWHYGARGDPVAGARILDDLERSPPRRPDDAVEQRIQAHIARHDLIRRPDESLKDFAKRCMAAAPATLDLSIDRKRPSRAERIAGLADRFADQVARLTADGTDTVAAERAAIESIAEDLLPG